MTVSPCSITRPMRPAESAPESNEPLKNTRLARYPGAILPISLSLPTFAAAVAVTARSTSIRDAPNASHARITGKMSSPAFAPPDAENPVPRASLTPDSQACRRARGGSWPGLTSGVKMTPRSLISCNRSWEDRTAALPSIPSTPARTIVSASASLPTCAIALSPRLWASLIAAAATVAGT